MMNDALALLRGAVLAAPLALIAFYLLAALHAVLSGRRTRGAPWRSASVAATAALATALFAAAAQWFTGGMPQAASLQAWGRFDGLTPSIRVDALASVMLLLVAFIGLIILRYARSYLAGEPRQAAFLSAYFASLAAVGLLVISNSLLWLGLAWTATSLALHQLLSFYRERPQAQIAAHKKFLVSRLADLCLFGAALLLAMTYRTLDIDRINALAAAAPLSAGAQAAAVLLAITAALKCAQLPFHGWLIQVMEAPTPVSALLHAGIVNIGGFVLIRMTPFMMQSEAAQTLLVLVGTSSAAIAALVMSTRVSIKVHLAWSTCAQMGFMLVECGLGAYSLALLHLVGHSLYKAHAFLASGSTVEVWRTQAQARKPGPAAAWAWVAAPLAAAGMVAALAFATGLNAQAEPVTGTLLLIVGLALTPLMVQALGSNLGTALRLVAAAGLITALYLISHAAFDHVLALPAAPQASNLRLAVVLLGFGLLYLLYAAIATRPAGRLARTLQPHLFAGLYLDELLTRLTFRLWPARLPPPPSLPGSGRNPFTPLVAHTAPKD